VTLRASSRVVLAGLLGPAAALLVSCGGSSGKLIPVADAGPLQSDFEAVAREAEAGNGSCSATEAAITTTEQDFSALPASVDAGLRSTLRQGIENLRTHALVLCAQPLVQTNTATTILKVTTPPTTTTTTTTATTPTIPPTSTTPTTPTTSTTGGGTVAPGAGESPAGEGQAGESPAGESGSSSGRTGAGGGQEAER
jgi:hypothetical protein